MPVFGHGDNIAQKRNHPTKYRDAQSKQFLAEIESRYEAWKKANLGLKGSEESVIKQRTELLNDYKDFIDQQKYAEQFDSRSNLHSSVLEEFLVYLFDGALPHSNLKPLVGKGQTFKSFFLGSKNFEDFLTTPEVFIETKDHDFVIGTSLTADFNGQDGNRLSRNVLQIPAVAIECKTYLDKTMLEGASLSADELKRINPSARYIIVAEWLKLTEAVNLPKYRIDQIYVLRKQKNTDREFRYASTYKKNPIYADLVWDLFTYVVGYLSRDRWDIDAAVARGKLL